MEYQDLFVLKNLYELSRGNKSFEKKILTLYISESYKILEEMNHALIKSDWEQLAFFAHKIKATIKLFEIKTALFLVEVTENKENKYTPSEITKAYREFESILNLVLLQFEQILQKEYKEIE